ncbi:protein of unknown function [Salinimicrobium catena]|uniref:DUF1206 domain-containing protein n=1 Tax=Salinimicrobium catena TaxID=390640 RepID=A0A1H5NNK6_9FLAO|nr:DUF1206 domain-containing protein [Salinimicrobium catena]SDL56128.1 protein of unknown function [Salinimicrobium catena]SEF03242.1 protein of unknown function [Salinimicrobium catena]
MDDKIKKVARTGFVAKGTVYAITGILTFMAAFNMGGQKAGRIQVLEFLDKQTFGNILLILMAIGLASYATWRFIQSVKDPENIGDDTKGKAKKTAFFISGIIYLGLAVLAVMRVIGSGSGSSGSSGAAQKSSFLASETGLIFIGIAGAGIAIAGIFQFVKAYRNDYAKKFDLSSLSEEKKRKSIKNTAKFGLSSRGVIFLIIGYFALKAAFSADPSKIKTTTEAFSFIQESSYGAWLMGLVAAGLVAYAIYMFLMAKYRRFPA